LAFHPDPDPALIIINNIIIIIILTRPLYCQETWYLLDVLGATASFFFFSLFFLSKIPGQDTITANRHVQRCGRPVRPIAVHHAQKP
jgi:hypothetical protein